MNEINWEEIRKIIDDTAAKRDRKVKIFISTTTGTSISIEPWPDMDREEDFINSKSRFNLKFKGE